jgi:hypothetical protein
MAGFAVWSTGPPEPTVELHRARLGDDRQYRDLLEEQFHNRQLGRKGLIACLFGGSVVMVVTAFMTMRPAESQRPGSSVGPPA